MKHLKNFKSKLYESSEPEPGDMVTLNEPYLGYRRAKLIEFGHNKWTIELPSGKQIEVYPDEFEVD